MRCVFTFRANANTSGIHSQDGWSCCSADGKVNVKAEDVWNHEYPTIGRINNWFLLTVAQCVFHRDLRRHSLKLQHRRDIVNAWEKMSIATIKSMLPPICYERVNLHLTCLHNTYLELSIHRNQQVYWLSMVERIAPLCCSWSSVTRMCRFKIQGTAMTNVDCEERDQDWKSDRWTLGMKSTTVWQQVRSLLTVHAKIKKGLLGPTHNVDRPNSRIHLQTLQATETGWHVDSSSKKDQHTHTGQHISPVVLWYY